MTILRTKTSLLLAVLSIFSSPAVSAQEACVVKGETLTQARNNFTSQCTVTRIDCDPFGGEWYCASYTMNASSPPALTISPTLSAPVLTLQPIAPDARASCTRADSDSDGDGFGWENNNTCLVTNSFTPASPTVSSEPESGRTANRPVTAADITDLILVTGQSNALGAGTTYDRSADAPSDSVFAFTEQGWQIADLNQVWDLGYHPRNDPETEPSNNFSLHFGKSLAARDPSRVVGFVLATAPGAKIETWDLDNPFYSTVQTKVLDAINQLPHKSALDGILWHQGESDGQDRQSYTDAIYTLIYNLRNESWTQPHAPFICGETKIDSINRRLNALNNDSDPNTACVRASDLSTIGDDRHFDAQALRTLGARYADSYLKLSR